MRRFWENLKRSGGLTEVRVFKPDEVPDELKALFNGIFGSDDNNESSAKKERHHVNHGCNECAAVSSLASFSTEFIYSMDEAFDPNDNCNKMELNDYTAEYLLGAFRQAIGSIEFARRTIDATIGECGTSKDIADALVGMERAFMATCNILINSDKCSKK